MLPGTQLEQPWAAPAEAVAAALVTDPAAGLTDGEAADRLRLVGSNELVERGRRSPWRLLAEQFANTMILVLVAAAVVTAVIGDLLRGQVEGLSEEGKVNVAFVPLGTPLLAGRGAIAAIMVFMREADTAAERVGVALGLVGVLVVLWLTLRFAGVVRRLRSARPASSW
jgi:Cation transporter/ATPase, N-terminus/MarC family integral membrane protein